MIWRIKVILVDGYYLFSDNELYNAKCLTIFNIHEHEEPLPKNRDKFIEEMYEKVAGRQNCNSVYIQKMPFRFTKSFIFKRYHSTKSMSIADDFFVDDYSKECCERYNLKGFTFDLVYSGRRKDILKKTHQFHITLTLNFEADMKSYKDIKNVIYVINICIPFFNVEPNITYYNESELAKCRLDVAYSKEHIGVSIAATFQQIIITNKMYHILKDNHLDKDFKFDVIQLI